MALGRPARTGTLMAAEKTMEVSCPVAAADDWVVRTAGEVRAEAMRRHPGEPPTCASGISPSGPVHLGNLRELMTPRTAIVAFPEGILTAEAAHVLQQSGYSRYPVYRGSLDEVVGVAHTLDLLGRQPEDPILVRPPVTVPGTMRAADLMLEMQRGGRHLAVVLDEFGGTAGLVTFEDLLNDLVSELFEPTAGTTDVTRVVEVEGSTPASELADKLGGGVELGGTVGRAQTVAGLLIQILGRIPRAGERFLSGQFKKTAITQQLAKRRRLYGHPMQPSRPD